jgi:hypothetical protein
VRFDFIGKPFRAGSVMLGIRSVVLEGVIEKADYEKLTALYQERMNAWPWVFWPACTRVARW